MSDFLEKLFHTTKAKEFAASFKEAQEKYASPLEFVRDVAAYLPIRLYEHYYDDTVPHSAFGLACANLVQNNFPEEQRWRPFAQQTWFAVQERKRSPLKLYSVDAKSEGDREARWGRFEQTAREGDFGEAFAWAKGFLGGAEEREYFRQQTLSYAVDDTFHGGHKFLYLFQMWQLAESLNWEHLDRLICPALHYLVVGTQDHSLSETVQQQWQRDPLTSVLDNQGSVSGSNYEELESALLTGPDIQSTFNALRSVARSGASFRAIQDALLVAAAQSLLNADSGEWIWPMRAFHFAYVAGAAVNGEPRRKTYALMMATALLHQASAKSRETDHNREVGDVARRFCPIEPFDVLRSVVSHTDPHASATAVYAILGMDEQKKEELFHALCSLAVKNDGDVCYGNDILFLHESLDCYRNSSIEQKDKVPVSAGYFLGRVRKKYDLFGAYGF